MRAFKAARRSAERRPVPFLYEWEERVEEKDPETDEVVGVSYVTRKRLFECRGSISSLLLSKLAQNADVSTADPSGMALISEFFEQAFGVPYKDSVDEETGEPRKDAAGFVVQEIDTLSPEYATFQQFFRLHNRHGDDDLLMEIIGGLVEDFSARPTASPSPSQSGPEPTGEFSKVVSLSRGSVEVVEGSVTESSPESSSASALGSS